MKISKKAGGAPECEGSASDLALINALAKKELTQQEVFTFSVLLCDNNIDRDHERFTTEALHTLAELFVGKTGISDHNWTSGNQVSRIYRTEVIEDPSRVIVTGENYAYLKAYAYILRNDANAALIADIEGGIKKEVSVGCAVARTVCSVCGEEMGSGKCGHIRGADYDGTLCYAELSEPTDAYEWSFVAVPAQVNAGVTKGFEERPKTLEDFARLSDERIAKQYERLLREAEVGRMHIRDLKNEVIRLGRLCGERIEIEELDGIIDKLSARELEAVKASFEYRIEQMFPPVTQLRPYRAETADISDREYII
ncbi:MAG: hypothetical protein IJ072_03315 [Oscillospiraceae bacterium]|nr:hypothetical protein [Oscillospiraceae bacterium]